MVNAKKLLPLVVIALFGATRAVSAQDTTKVVHPDTTARATTDSARVVAARDYAPPADFRAVDRIVAVVGGKPILMSRVQEEFNVYKAQPNAKLPDDSAGIVAFKRDIVNRLVNDELVVQAATKDTAIKISLTDIQSSVDDAVKNVREQFSSDLEFQRQLRLSGFGTPEDYREWLYEQKRRENLSKQFMAKLRQKGLIKAIPATEAEGKAYYEQNKGSLPHRPATVTFRQIVIRPEPDAPAVAVARQKADTVVKQLRRGADFATMAKRFSEDDASKEQGGELGWFRRGNGLAREFEAVAFGLRPGQISDPVRTPFGFHIIQVERIDAAEIQARHILFIPTLTDANRATAALKADTVARTLRGGGSFDSLARIYHDPVEDQLADNVPTNTLPQEYAQVLQTAKPGDIVGPFQVPSPTGVTKYVVAVFQLARAEGEMSYEELRDQIKANLGETRAMTRYLDELKKHTYVDIRL
jgi:parvulin-like peptidyl-prolyl isomerase